MNPKRLLRFAARCLVLAALLVAGLPAVFGDPSESIGAGANGTIDTFAGGGANTGEGVPATSASLSLPLGVAVNSSGEVFISEATRCRVRKVSGGVITTFAGTACATGSDSTYAGDGGPATLAVLYRPTGIAVDADSNLYIADSLNCSIRKVDARTGITTTFAGIGPSGCGGALGDGGPATSAHFLLPNAVAVDASGDVYVADTSHCRVRKISGGIITTFAGAGFVSGSCIYGGDGGPAVDAYLGEPTGLGFAPNGDLYIADHSNCRVRKVSAGIITTVAGTGDCYFDPDGPAASTRLQPYGLAADVYGNIYITDPTRCHVRVLSGGQITTVAGTLVELSDTPPTYYEVCGFGGDGGAATDAQLDVPAAVALDAAGNLYIAEAFNQRIRVVWGVATPAAVRPAPGGVPRLVKPTLNPTVLVTATATPVMNASSPVAAEPPASSAGTLPGSAPASLDAGVGPAITLPGAGTGHAGATPVAPLVAASLLALAALSGVASRLLRR